MKRIFWRDAAWVDRPIAGATCVLDVGAGGRRRAGQVTTMDRRALPETDVLHDAEVVPWPFEDNQFDYIILSHVLEHCADIGAVLKELHRIAKPGACIRIVCPHFSNPCSQVDVTHRHALSVLSLDIFCLAPAAAPVWALCLKRVLGCDMQVDAIFRENLFRLQRRSLYFREILWWTLLPLWANRWPEWYEVYGSRLFPAWAVYWELEVVKDRCFP